MSSYTDLLGFIEISSSHCSYKENFNISQVKRLVKFLRRMHYNSVYVYGNTKFTPLWF